ncbi:YbhB/YbcL family Raf kinase inhibitor-like protein [Patescibacteria group bacterium]|nr:YbhB/YbcL family Raf kinase inhibitor-like protein [Patescibacteria group bacterium]MBU1727931.1 YbhB/YbcL family Raf kinase inhibitor-like protein [Patescibacteria group bacterium]
MQVTCNPIVNLGDEQSSKSGLSPKSTTGYNINMQMESPSFKYGEEIPSKFTCDGEGVNPSLVLKNVPKEAKSLALVVYDPDAPSGTWIHWLVWNISPETSDINENSIPAGAVVGENSWPRNSYGGPCPPDGSHRYFFKIYALNTTLNIPENSKFQDLENSIKDHVLAEAELMGRYKRK